MIIPVFRVLTTQVPIAATTTIEAGMVVTLNSSTGYAEKCDLVDIPIGIAADRNRASESYEWVNRVSDSGNETAASGMLLFMLVVSSMLMLMIVLLQHLMEHLLLVLL